MEFKFNVTDNVIYTKSGEESKLATIFKKRSNSNEPCYLIYKIEDKTSEDMVTESELEASTKTAVINHFWDKFIYDGSNINASNFIINNILKNVGNVNNISWGPNSDNTKYILKIEDENEWSKDKI
jgi:hypothetical protein|tara:strand:- start:97 stop:474 length:378 start_codon:yes stop_codon:yes gene_type:complete